MAYKWNPIIEVGARPKYIALVETIEAEIASGKLHYGDRLPSNRELGEMFGVTVATVTKAMAEAGRRGLVNARIGSGTYISEGPNEQTPVTQSQTDLALNTLPIKIVEDLLQAALARISPERHSELLFAYSSYSNSTRDRTHGANWISRFGDKVEPGNVLLTTGVHQGLLAAFRVLLSPGDVAVCENLTYAGIKRIAEFRGVNLAGAECDHEGLIPDSVERELARTKAKALVLTPTLHNPTTATLSLERRKAIAKICSKADVFIIEDAINVPLANETLPALMSFAPERTIYLTGFSKCIASGYRLGYAAMPESLLERYSEALVGTQWIGPTLFSELAAIMFNEGMIDECIARHRVEATFRTALARSILKGVRNSNPSAYHAWVDSPLTWNSDDFCAHALRAGIQLSPGAHFAVSTEHQSTGYRISLGTVQDRTKLESALRQVALLSEGSNPRFRTLI